MTPSITISVQVDEHTTLVIEREYPDQEHEVIRDVAGAEVNRMSTAALGADQVTKIAGAVAAALLNGGLQ